MTLNSSTPSGAPGTADGGGAEAGAAMGLAGARGAEAATITGGG